MQTNNKKASIRRNFGLNTASKKRCLNTSGISAGLGAFLLQSLAPAAMAAPVSPVHNTALQITAVHNAAVHNAAPLHNTSTTRSSTAGSLSPASLNLSSPSHSLSAGLLGRFQSLTLDIGGKREVVTMTSKITDAEFIAASQLLGGGLQTLNLSSSGAASGGNVQLNSSLFAELTSALGGSIGAVVIPAKTTINDSLTTLTLAGSLSNYGSIFASAPGASISASSILNSGVISASNGSLTLSAATIANSGVISGKNVTLNTGLLNNTGGTVSSATTINISHHDGLNIVGGNLLSQTLNLDAGAGALNVTGTNITGVVNDTAASAHINAVSKNFLLGVSDVSGDPLFDNTGNFIITSAISPTNGSWLTIVAGGNISATGSSQLVTDGAPLTLVAGANFTIDQQSGNLVISQSNLPTGGSSTGGSINLTNVTQINTSGASGGGAVNLIAYGGSGAGAGSISLPSSLTINTSFAGGAAGGVTVIGGAKSGSAVSLGDINTSGSTPGVVDIEAAVPIVPGLGQSYSLATGMQTGGGAFRPSTPNAVQGTVSVGNITSQNGDLLSSGPIVTINSAGTVSFGTIDTSGAGGAAAALSSPGQAAGGVLVNARGNVSGANVFAYGGGGSGGAGQQAIAGPFASSGGTGGAGGAVTLTTSTGNIALSGVINTAGGGGGGGGASLATFAGAVGGNGGFGGNVSLSALAGTVAVNQGVITLGGGSGGNGGSSSGTIEAGGGGGGGSFGGGGGGGGAPSVGSSTGYGGAGGGGLFGGGGGGNGITVATTLGGSGGGAGISGSGPSGAINLGQPNSGGGGATGSAVSGLVAAMAGGTVGAGGLAFTLVGGTTVGTNVINNNLATGGSVNITGLSGIGTATAPLQINSPSISLSAAKGSLFTTSMVNASFFNLVSSNTGTVQLTSAGMGINAPINAATVTLSTTNQSNGDISLNSGNLLATGTVTLNANGAGNISEASYVITAPTVVASSGNGIINLNNSVGNNINNFTFNTAGFGVSLLNAQNLTLKASSDTGIGSQVNINTLNSSLTIGGAIVCNGSALFSAGTTLAANAQVTAPSGLSYSAASGAITSSVTMTNSGSITLSTLQGSFGSLTVNTPEIIVTANAANITDTYTGFTNVVATGLQGFGAFSVSSAASTLYLSNGGTGSPVIGNFGSVTVKNTNTTVGSGNIELDNGASSSIQSNGPVTISTINGSITALSGTSVSAVVGVGAITFTTTGGTNIGGFGGSALQVQGNSITVTGSASNTIVNLQVIPSNNTAVTLNASTANNFTLSTVFNDLYIVGKVVATGSLSLTGGNILQTNTVGSLSANQISLSGNSIGNNASSAGLTLAFTGGNTLLNINSGASGNADVNIQSSSPINLGTSNVNNGNLNIITTGALTQSGVVSVGNIASFSASGFSQAAGSTLKASVLNIFNPAGSLQVDSQGTSSSPSVISANILNITSSKNITLTAGFLADNTVSNDSYNATGTLSIPAALAATVATLSVPANPGLGGSGGILSVTASSFQVNGAAPTLPISLTATPALANGSGGSITLNLTGTANVTLNSTSPASGQIALNASGTGTGAGGSISVQTAAALTVLDQGSINSAPGSTGTGAGGNLTLISAKTLSVPGTTDLSINAKPATTGTVFGNITLSANGTAAQPFVIGAAAANGVATIITAGNVTITNSSGIQFGVVNAVTVNSAFLSLNTNNVNFAPSSRISDKGALIITSPGTLTFTGTIGFSNLPSSITVNSGGTGAFTFPQTLNLGAENILSVTSAGNLTLPVTTIAVAAFTGTGNGGSITINAPTITPAGLTLTANGTGAGSGGSVSFTETAGAALTVGTGGLIVNATTGTGAGGSTISIQNKGNITVTSTGIINTSAKPNNLSFVSTGGTLAVTPDLSTLNLTAGSNLTLGSNSSTAFNFSSTAGAVGPNGAGTTNATLPLGNISISNTGGNVSIGQAITASAAAPTVSSFAVNLTAKGSINQVAAADVITAQSIALNSGASVLQGNSSAFQISGNATGSNPVTNVSITTGATGTANVQDTQSATTDNLLSATNATQFTFASAGNLTQSASITGSTSVLLNSAGTFNALSGTNVSTKSLNFSLGTMASPLVTNATTIGANGATATNAVGNATINVIDTTTSVLTLGSSAPAGNIQTTGSAGTISIVSGGSITLAGSVGNGNFNAANTTLAAGASGSLTTGTGTTITGTQFLSLTAANLQGKTTGTALSVSGGGTLYLNSPGVVDIFDNVGANGSATIQSLPQTVKSFNFTVSGPITLNNITSSGNISVSDISASTPGGITTNTGTQLISTSATGLISLSSININSLGAINLNGNVLAPTVKVSTSGGNINIGAAVGQGVINGTASVTLISNADITESGGSGSSSGIGVFASILTFTAADVGSSFQNLVTNATTINQTGTSAGTGASNGIYISDNTNNTLTVNNLVVSGGAGTVVVLNTNGNLVVPKGGTIFAGGQENLSIGGSLSLAGSIGSTSASLTMNTGNSFGGSLVIPDGGGSIFVPAGGGAATSLLGSTVSLNANSGNISGNAGAPLNTAITTALLVSASGDVNLSNTTNSPINVSTLGINGVRSLTLVNQGSSSPGAITLGPIAAVSQDGGGVSIKNIQASITVGGPGINALGPISLTTVTSGDIGINANVQTQNGNISVSAAGSATGIMVADGVTISTANGGNVSLNATGAGALGAIKFTGGATVSTNAVFPSNGNISIVGIGNVSLGTASFQTGGTGSIIVTSGTASNPATISSGNGLVLSTANGALTFNGTQNVTLGTGVNLTTVNGSLSITAGAGTLSVGTGSNIQSGGTLTLTGNTGLTIGDSTALSAVSNMLINTSSTSTAAGLSIGLASAGSGRNINSGGNITISNASSTGTILIGQSYSISTTAQAPGAGTVTIDVAGTAGTTNAISTGGQIVVDVSSTVTPLSAPGSAAATFTVSNSPQTLTLFGENAQILIANNGSVGASAITFGGSNFITADPPALASVAAASNISISAAMASNAGIAPQLHLQAQSINGMSLSILPAQTSATLSSTSSAAANSYTSASSMSNVNAESSASQISLPTLSSINSAFAPSAQALLASLNAGNLMANIQVSGLVASKQDFSTNMISGNTVVKTPGRDGILMAGTKHGQSVVNKEILQGAMLLAPEQKTDLQTPFGIVHLAERSVALIVCNEHGLVVYNLDDNHRNAVSVSANGETIGLTPGRMVAITDNGVGEFEQINPAQYVGYRGISTQELNGNLKAFHAEFNHLSVVAGLEPLRNMIKSKEQAKRKLGAHLLKTSSALSAMSSNKATFQLHSAPSITAMK